MKSLRLEISTVIAVVLTLVWSGSSPGQVCINEVLYDPAGPDTGVEYVELYNAGQTTVSLADWRLEAGNGASAGDWRLQWTGDRSYTLNPGAFFLLAGEQVEGAVDVSIKLSLQNGPDGLRLLSSAGDLVDLVGWGRLEYNEFYESRPASDAPSGFALVRLPDGEDTNNNADDFEPSEILTPGSPNLPEFALLLSELSCDPPLVGLGESARLVVRLSNRGAQSISLTDLTWRLIGENILFTPVSNAVSEIDPGETIEMLWSISATTNQGQAQAITLSLYHHQTHVAAESSSIRFGRGAILISEILYDPAQDQPEWVELYNRHDQAVDLSGWQLIDASGRATVIGPEPAPIASGGWGILSQAESEMASAWPALPVELIIPRSGSWPSLNNTIDSDLGYADQLLLLDSDGVPSDLLAYRPGDLDGGGISLERWIEGGELVEDELLVPSASPNGATPGGSSWQQTSPETGSIWLQPEPNPFCPDCPGADRLCRIIVPYAGSGRLSADLYSLAGFRLVTLTTAARVSSPLMLVWDGCDSAGRPLPTGSYLFRITFSGSESDGSWSLLRSVVLARC